MVLSADVHAVRRWKLVGCWWFDRCGMCCMGGWCKVGRESERWWWSWRSSCDAVKAQRGSGGSVVAWRGLGSLHEVLGLLAAEQEGVCCAQKRHSGQHEP